MKILLILALAVVFFYKTALVNFFAQDDFILINQFSQNNLWDDLKNFFGPPQVTHWRPVHNLFFLVGGNIFGRNYVGYHLTTFLFQIGVIFLIYKIVKKLTNSQKAGIIAGLIYAIHPAHFVSLFWISGGATIIGFFFLISSLYSQLLKKRGVSLILYAISLLASEAMIVGAMLFAAYTFLFERKKIDRLFLTAVGVFSAIFFTIRFAFFTPKTTFDVYQAELSPKLFLTIKYYFLRIAGFAETSGDEIVSFVLLGWLILIALMLVNMLKKRLNINLAIFSIVVISAGLFPFILIPQHLSPHYMNVSIFGFAMLVGIILKTTRRFMAIATIVIFLIISGYNINLTIKATF